MGGGKTNPSSDLQQGMQASVQAAQVASNAATTQGWTALNTLQNMYQTSQQQVSNYYQQGLGETSPYNLAGSNALDAYMQSLGLSTPVGGSFNLQQANLANQAQQNYTAQMKQYDQQAQSMYQQAMGWYGPWSKQAAGGGKAAAADIAALNAFNVNNPQSVSNLYNALAVGEIESPDAAKGNAPVSSSGQVAANFSGLASGPPVMPQNMPTNAQSQLAQQYQNGGVPMQQTGPSSILQSFANTGEAQMLGYNPQQSIVQNFQNNSPGYQFALQQGDQAINQAASAGGYLNNPNLLAYMSNYNQGLANQQFGQYQNQLQGAFQNYQSSLGQLAGMGAGVASGNQNAANRVGEVLGGSTQQQGQNLANIFTGIGNTQANAALAQGQAQASMFTNQANIAAANQQSLFGAGASLGGALLGLL